jgi:hypothetical protein
MLQMLLDPNESVIQPQVDIPDQPQLEPLYPTSTASVYCVAGVNPVGYVPPFFRQAAPITSTTLRRNFEACNLGRFLGNLAWQRYLGRQIVHPVETMFLNGEFKPIRRANFVDGAFILDGLTLQVDDQGKMALQAIGNFLGTIPEIPAPIRQSPFFPPAGLSVQPVPNQTAFVNISVRPIQLVAFGGTTPYAFSATGLPAGVSCSLSGLITGSPTTA